METKGEDCQTEASGEGALLGEGGLLGTKHPAGNQSPLLTRGTQRMFASPPVNGRSVEKQYPERKLTFSPGDVIRFKKFLKGMKRTAAFFLLVVADCVWSYFILIQLFPVCTILPSRFYAILDFLLLSRVGNGLHSSCLRNQRDCFARR